MCGIVGYVGQNEAAPLLLHGLAKLEYRGYDSAGIAVRMRAQGIFRSSRRRDVCMCCRRRQMAAILWPAPAVSDIRAGDAREPSEANAHPHCTEDKSVVLVHNGIIENYQELKVKLTKAGYSFYSETDTEVAAKLIDYYYKKTGEPLEAITRAMLRFRGSYAFGILFKDFRARSLRRARTAR